MNILITGVHGFVGSNLVKALSPENTIYGLDIVAPEKDGIVKTFSWNDLGGIDLPQIDAVIHLAGKAHDTRNKSAADVYFKVIKAEDYIIGHFAPEALKRPYHNFDDGDSLVKGKNVYIIRPCMIHGPGNKGNLNLLYGVVNKGIPWPLGAFENRKAALGITRMPVRAKDGLMDTIRSFKQ